VSELEASMPRRCRRVHAWFDGLSADTLGPVRRRLAERHLGRCESCAAGWQVHQRVRDGVAALSLGQPDPGDPAVADPDRPVMADPDHPVVPDPPPELLDSLLAAAEDPGLRARAAVPARGAVSGARPGLTVMLLVVVLAIGGLAAWATWRAGRAIQRRIR
jgi:hypothetical protein